MFAGDGLCGFVGWLVDLVGMEEIGWDGIHTAAAAASMRFLPFTLLHSNCQQVSTHLSAPI